MCPLDTVLWMWGTGPTGERRVLHLYACPSPVGWLSADSNKADSRPLDRPELDCQEVAMTLEAA